MPEQRQDPTTGAWVVLSGDRGHRPIRLVTPELAPIDPSDCPFCRGNEAVTMPTLAERGDASGWLVRAFPNRFPALRVEGDVSRAQRGPWGWASGVGAHEVIAESPVHDQPLWAQPAQMRLAMAVARERMADLWQDSRFAHVSWFRNSGALAGASQPHPHAQVVANQTVPASVQNMAERMRAWHDSHGTDLLGDLLRHDLADGARVLWQDEHVVVTAPYAPRVSFETWVSPKVGGPFFHDASPGVVDAVADAMTAVLAAVHKVAAPPAYNALLFEAPRGQERGFRWHLRLTPRRVALGGFELTTGGTILHVAPEEAAERLRAAL